MALNDKTRKHNDMDFQKVRALACRNERSSGEAIGDE